MRLHGHTRLELTDIHTGAVEVVEKDNIITNAVGEIFNGYGGSLNKAMLLWRGQQDDPNAPKDLVTMFYGGLLLYDSPLGADPATRFAPAAAGITGTAIAGLVNATTNTTRGSANLTETKLDPAGGTMTYVYEFATNQGNGVIQSVCLTQPQGAYYSEMIDAPNASPVMAGRLSFGGALGGDQLLTGQLAANLVLRTGGADINNAVNGLGCTDRVQRAEDQMAGLGGGDGGGDRLIIAHLADQNDIRVLAQGAAQRRGKAARIRADLALVDERLPALIDILDGVLDRDDVVAAGLVDMVDHRGQRGGLAAAGGAGDKDQTARLVRQLCQHGRHRQLCQRGDGIVEQAQRGRSPPLLEKDIYAAAGAVRCDQRKIGIDPLGKNGLAVRLIHQPKDQGAGLVSAHLHGGLHQPPVHPEHQGQPLGEMDVAGFHLPRQRGEFMDLHGTYLIFEKEEPERALPSAPVPLIPHRR